MTPKALTLLTSGGNTFNPEFEAKVREEGNVELAQFLDFNGVACQWGQEGSDAVVVLAYARVTDAEARTAKNYLSTNGWVSSAQKDGSEAWSPSDLSNYLGNTPLCEFRSGNMRYMLDASSRAYFAV